MDEEARRTFGDAVFKIVDETIFGGSVSIMHAVDTELKDYRSGVLVQIADSRFLVTAAHDLMDWYKEGVDAFLVRGERGSHPVRIMTEKWHTSNDKEVDLAVCLLGPEMVAFLGRDQKYFRISDFIPRKECGGFWYAIVGFPKDKIGPDEGGIECASCWKYLTYPFKETERVLNYDPDIHLVLKYERSTTDGVRKVWPHAMSGCGIWHIARNLGESVGPDDIKLCAIENAWSKPNEYVKGTWTDIALKIIWTYYPDVRPAMRLHGCSF